MSRCDRCLCIISLLGLLLTVGCEDSNPLDRQAVTGTVTFGDEPLATGSISFIPTDPKGVMSGATITDGAFEIPADKGLPPGDYTVQVSAYDEDGEKIEAPGESNKIAKELIPAEYNTDSKVTFTVEAGEENTLPLTIPKP